MRQQEDNGPATAVHREAGALALADPLEVCTLDSVTAAFWFGSCQVNDMLCLWYESTDDIIWLLILLSGLEQAVGEVSLTDGMEEAE